VKVFFRPGDDHAIHNINEELEAAIDDLSNTKDKVILHELNNFPILATHAHTRPFRQKWLNITTGLILPAGIFFYLRMWRFRLRLMRDLRAIRNASEAITARIEERKDILL
jgi:lipopolysaccharide export system permease protein